MFLDEIMQSRRRDPRFMDGPSRLSVLQKRALAASPPRGFAASLRAAADRDGVALVAEIKRASPSKGELNAALDPARQAAAYEEAGAAAVSVLTEPHHFRGSLEDLEAARSASRLPVLRKDFLTEDWEVWESRAHGADAVLLIAGLLDAARLSHLRGLVEHLGMDALVEVHDEDELQAAVASGARLLGINNRDLRSFQEDLETTVRLSPLLPPDVLVVSESGIHRREDVERVAAAGARAVLVGESLVRDPDPGRRIHDLLAVEHTHERTP